MHISMKVKNEALFDFRIDRYTDYVGVSDCLCGLKNAPIFGF